MASTLGFSLHQTLQRACHWLGCGHLQGAKMDRFNHCPPSMAEPGQKCPFPPPPPSALFPAPADLPGSLAQVTRLGPWRRFPGLVPIHGCRQASPRGQQLRRQMLQPGLLIKVTGAPPRSNYSLNHPWVQSSWPRGVRCQPAHGAPRVPSHIHCALFLAETQSVGLCVGIGVGAWNRGVSVHIIRDDNGLLLRTLPVRH